MSRLSVFNTISLDGYFVDQTGDMSWAHNNAKDEEWDAFVAGNASSGKRLLFGRITYDLMANYWPTPMAMARDPIIANGMNNIEKIVFSRTLKTVSWGHTTIVDGNIEIEVTKLKDDQGGDIVILGSGSIISQLAQFDLIDQYQFVVNPVIIGKGRTLFEGISRRINLALKSTRVFGNGNVLLNYVAIR
jgi:dihydrofolate reductase